jgi:Acetyltransferase (GNAT) family
MMYVAMVPGNIPYCVELARELHSKGVFGRQGPEFDWDYCTAQFIRVAESRSCYARFAVSDNNEYVGGVVGHLDSFMFSSQLMGLEDALYVKEDTPHRAAIGSALLKGFTDWCFHMGAVLVQTGDIAAIDSYAVYKFYMHNGFEKFGVVYQKRRV